MRASVQHDTTQRIITLEISGVPDVDTTENWHAKPRAFRPNYVTIQIVDGVVQELKASGGLILKSGEPSTQVRGDKSWRQDLARNWGHKLSSAPQWVRTLWAEAPAGVTSWTEEGKP